MFQSRECRHQITIASLILLLILSQSLPLKTTPFLRHSHQQNIQEHMAAAPTFALLFLVAVLAVSSPSDAVLNNCVYTIYIKTGSEINTGTDSKIGATISDAAGQRVRVEDLEDWVGLPKKGASVSHFR